MPVEVPLQANFLTGEFVDKRTRQQKRTDKARELPVQAEMFSQREVALFGVRANPQISLSEHTKLVLIAPDLRTPEEIEHEQLQAAQALTKPLFAEPVAASAPEPIKPTAAPNELLSASPYPPFQSGLDTDTDEADDEVVSHTPLPKHSKIEVYTQLVNIAAERAMTLYACRTIAIAQAIGVAVAQSEAKHAGLSQEEILMAIKIGEFRGKAEKRVPIPPKPASANSSPPVGEYGVLLVHGRGSQPMEMAKV